MEQKKEERQMGLRLKPIYTIDKDRRIGSDISNPNIYLYKNGAIANCPFKAIGTRDGVAMIPCGEDCPHFHFVPETKKVPAKPKEGEENKEATMETIETGKIFVRLTCGSGSNGNGIHLPIANINAAGVKPEPSPLKVVKPNE
jgi:hypothetical protein